MEFTGITTIHRVNSIQTNINTTLVFNTCQSSVASLWALLQFVLLVSHQVTSGAVLSSCLIGFIGFVASGWMWSEIIDLYTSEWILLLLLAVTPVSLFDQQTYTSASELCLCASTSELRLCASASELRLCASASELRLCASVSELSPQNSASVYPY